MAGRGRHSGDPKSAKKRVREHIGEELAGGSASIATQSAVSQSSDSGSRPDRTSVATNPWYTAQGRVVTADTKQGVGGLSVTLYHVVTPDAYSSSLNTILEGATRLGSTSTTEPTGEFALRYSATDISSALNDSARINLVAVVSAPEDGQQGSSDGVLYFSRAPRVGAARHEYFAVNLSREALNQVHLGDESTLEGSLTSYRRRRLQEKALNDGIVNFHRDEIEQDTREKRRVRSDLLSILGTDPNTVVITGEMVGDGEKIADKLDIVIKRALTKANEQLGGSRGVPINLYLTPADAERLAPFFDSAVDGVAKIPESELGPILFGGEGTVSPITTLIHANPIAKYCSEQTFEQKCAEDHVGLPSSYDPGHVDSRESGTILAVTTRADPVFTNDDVSKHMGRILAGAPSPDLVLGGGLVGLRPNLETIENDVDRFSLRRGPADVAAFYDFHSLEIAFEHVWRNLFDEDLVETAHAAEKHYFEMTGASLSATFPHWTDLASVTNVYGSVPQVVPADVAAQFDINLQEWTDLSAAHRTKLHDIAKELAAVGEGTVSVSVSIPPIGPVSVNVPASKLGTFSVERKRQDLREQGERLIDSVRHDDYYTLHKTLRELHARINAKYEFTVFAADKTTQAVNFGLLNTFRQEWTPINYQAGKLVKTVPLSPKEERKYSMKVTRNYKQARKEAMKHSSSMAYEQSSTSRVEAEIIQRALTKTNFSLSTDGSYNIGISKGKSTTTFGVEAEQESTQTRKDFREAVLKATQEFKEERAVDVDTEETTGSEYTESGTIVNPNDELSVTYLFYELQRRYRIAERLHRVLPVVLVAQEVPAPHQITEGWVIAHDWIINRALLDDSFRPALGYIANRSVGDDFALRELRKNLRQQRNLVETLRFELAIAGNEAENRYRALENAIAKRIGEEETEQTDGWFEDIGDFFGGGGQDPEAAKARELAAKDAHQYAVEKAEKAASALRQEMGSLHTLTAEYNNTLRTHLDNETRVKRLLAHIRNNIFHYMHAVWNMEPPDQRFMRLHKVQVPVLDLALVTDPATGAAIPDRHYRVQVQPAADIFAAFRKPGTTKHKAVMSGTLKPVTEFRSLVDVADLDSPVGCKGNYMIFPLKEHNALTEFMAAPYVDSAFGAMDPDDLSNVSLNDYAAYVCCLHERLSADAFAELKPLLQAWLKLLMADPLRNGDEITVPTDSLFIEILPGAHPLLEDFKLRHRELDVLKVAEEVRKARLETLRLAARLLHGEREDPDIERKILVEGNAAVVMPPADV